MKLQTPTFPTVDVGWPAPLVLRTVKDNPGGVGHCDIMVGDCLGSFRAFSCWATPLKIVGNVIVSLVSISNAG